MTLGELECVDARRHRLRHIKPYAAGQGLVESAQTIFGRAYAFEELPISELPSSRDFSEATWTGRLLDAGELEVTFPNKEASDGQPWRSRFETFGHLEFIEVYRDDALEHVDCILKVSPTQQAVVVTGQDGWALLRSAYERNWVCVQAPRDVIERASYLWTMTLGDEFKEFDSERWTAFDTIEAGGAGGSAIVTNGLQMDISAAAAKKGVIGIRSSGLAIPKNSRWRLNTTFTITAQTNGGGSSGENSVKYVLSIVNGSERFSLVAEPFNTKLAGSTASGTQPAIGKLEQTFLKRTGGGDEIFEIQLPLELPLGPHSMEIEADGRFVRCYIDGYFVGELPAFVPSPATVEFSVQVGGSATTSTSLGEVIVQEMLLRQAEPFLMRGTGAGEKGEVRLPGDAQTYPFGGLNGRYYNDLDLQEQTNYYERCFAQERSLDKHIQYNDRTDAEINGTTAGNAPPYPGANLENIFWSCRWFGSVWLEPGSYTFTAGRNEAGTALRLWVGHTNFTEPLINSWEQATATQPSATFTCERAGWYPIIYEMAKGSKATAITALYFTPPAEYTDPGGKKLKPELQHIPATSLSPLGCVDQHFQGSSHFNITKEAAEDFGYQMYCEPRQLESGCFPGQLIPQERIGRDTDEILEADSFSSRSPVTNYKNTVDATDQATSLLGTGAGLPNGQSGQISAEEFSIELMEDALFDLQGWVDASDINSPSLLAARIGSQLSLQADPWQNIEGEPLARDRLSDTFPLTGVLAALRWRPGDGIRIWLPDVNVEDTECRQIMQVTRQFGPVGRHGDGVAPAPDRPGEPDQQARAPRDPAAAQLPETARDAARDGLRHGKTAGERRCRQRPGAARPRRHDRSGHAHHLGPQPRRESQGQRERRDLRKGASQHRPTRGAGDPQRSQLRRDRARRPRKHQLDRRLHPSPPDRPGPPLGADEHFRAVGGRPLSETVVFGHQHNAGRGAAACRVAAERVADRVFVVFAAARDFRDPAEVFAFDFAVDGEQFAAARRCRVRDRPHRRAQQSGVPRRHVFRAGAVPERVGRLERRVAVLIQRAERDRERAVGGRATADVLDGAARARRGGGQARRRGERRDVLGEGFGRRRGAGLVGHDHRVVAAARVEHGAAPAGGGPAHVDRARQRAVAVERQDAFGEFRRRRFAVVARVEGRGARAVAVGHVERVGRRLRERRVEVRVQLRDARRSGRRRGAGRRRRGGGHSRRARRAGLCGLQDADGLADLDRLVVAMLLDGLALARVVRAAAFVAGMLEDVLSRRHLGLRHVGVGGAEHQRHQREHASGTATAKAHPPRLARGPAPAAEWPTRSRTYLLAGSGSNLAHVRTSSGVRTGPGACPRCRGAFV
jgi:hypothetical protein